MTGDCLGESALLGEGEVDLHRGQSQELGFPPVCGGPISLPYIFQIGVGGGGAERGGECNVKFLEEGVDPQR